MNVRFALVESIVKDIPCTRTEEEDAPNALFSGIECAVALSE